MNALGDFVTGADVRTKIVRVEPFRITVRERRARRGRLIHAWVIDTRWSLLGNVVYAVVYAVPMCESPAPAWTADHDGDVYASNEGITWARGWSGEDVDALKVALALV